MHAQYSSSARVQVELAARKDCRVCKGTGVKQRN